MNFLQLKRLPSLSPVTFLSEIRYSRQLSPLDHTPNSLIDDNTANRAIYILPMHRYLFPSRTSDHESSATEEDLLPLHIGATYKSQKSLLRDNLQVHEREQGPYQRSQSRPIH